jgi:hypothetical protein
MNKTGIILLSPFELSFIGFCQSVWAGLDSYSLSSQLLKLENRRDEVL